MFEVVQEPVLGFYIQVARRVPADQIEHFEQATGQKWDIDGIAIGNFTQPGPKYAILKDGEVLAVGGFSVQRPGVVRDFFLSVPEAFDPENFRTVTRLCKRLMAHVLDSGAHRIECIVPAKRVEKMPQLERWYSILGYNFEARHHGYCADGSDALCYSRVRH
jgi:hypothetical protein